MSGSSFIATGETEIPWMRLPLCKEQTFNHSYHLTHVEYHGLDHESGIAYRATFDIYGRFWFSAFSVEDYTPGDEMDIELFITHLLPDSEIGEILGLDVRTYHK